jgi:hypothetical protein
MSTVASSEARKVDSTEAAPACHTSRETFASGGNVPCVWTNVMHGVKQFEEASCN